MSFLSTAFRPVKLLLTGLDRLLVNLATPFGVRITEPRKRYGILFGIYAVIYGIGSLPVPVLPLIALTVGYVGVLAVGRAWVLNEKERTLIAKKLKEGNPDEMPDLRWTALVSALQLLILWPLIFMQVQRHFGLFTVPEGANFWTWVLFTLDSYNKAILGLLQVYGIHFEEVGLDSTWGRHLVTLCRLTFDYLLIQGVFRVLAIRETIRDSVAAVKTDPDMAVRIGRRAVGPLINTLLKDLDADVRKGAIAALGKLKDHLAVEPLINALKDRDSAVRCDAAMTLAELKDTRAVEPLINALQDWSNRWIPAEALGELKDARAVEPLINALHDPEELVRRAAARAFGELIDSRAVEPLIKALQDPADYLTRSEVVKALGKSQDSRAVGPLVQILNEDRGRDGEFLRGRAAEALSELQDNRAVEPLISVLRYIEPNSGRWGNVEIENVRIRAATALGRLKDGRAIEPLIMALHDPHISVRWKAAEALGELQDHRAIEPLINALQNENVLAALALGKLRDRQAVVPLIDALGATEEAVRHNAVWALGELKDQRAVEPLIKALRDTAAAVRQNAASVLGQLHDSRAVEPLIKALRDTAAAVRQNAAWSLGQLNDPKAIESLIAVLQDSDDDVRWVTAAALKKLDPAAAAKAGLK